CDRTHRSHVTTSKLLSFTPDYVLTITLDVILFFFFNDPATTEIYTLSLHDALPISHGDALRGQCILRGHGELHFRAGGDEHRARSEEHTSELQSRRDLVCRLLLEKKKK